MNKPANKKLIGLFVLGATALLVVAVVIFGSGKIFSKTVPVVFYFEGSVRGLDEGSPLVIRGVKVGGVTRVQLVYDPKDMSMGIPVYAEFDPEKITRVGGVSYQSWERKEKIKVLVEHGLRAQLQMQSIVTGQLMVNIDFLPHTKARLVSKNPEEIEIPTIPTVLEEITQKLQDLPVDEIIDKMTTALDGFNTVINSPELQEGLKKGGKTLDDLNKLIAVVNQEFKPAVQEARALMRNADQLVGKVDRRFEPLVSKVEGTLDEVGPMVSDLKKTLAKADGTLDETRKLVDQANAEMGPILADVKKTLAEAHSAMAHAQKTLDAAEINYYEGSEFYQTLTDTLQRADEASRSAQLLIEYLQRNPDALVWGKKDRRNRE